LLAFNRWAERADTGCVGSTELNTSWSQRLTFGALISVSIAIGWTASWTATGALGFRGWVDLVAGAGIFMLVGLPLLFVLVGIPISRILGASAEAMLAREEKLRQESRRREFESRLQRALELADDEADALEVLTRSFGVLAASQPTELLLADSSRAHLRAVASHPEGSGPGCGVPSPSQCAAVRRGQTAVFASSTELDACPHLRHRPEGDRSAVCVPVTVLGTSVGVLHATARPGDPPGHDIVVGLEAIANQAGARIGMIRALSSSQVQASTDPLTGMLNRRSLEVAMRPVLEGGLPFAVLMADLDHFKILNDTFGHDAGDRALRIFASAVRRTLRPADLSSRHGGEEFLIVLPECGALEAATAAERLREAIALANLSDGTAPGFTVSFGVADSETFGTDFSVLVTVADGALRDAKRRGRDRVVLAADPPTRNAAPAAGVTGAADRH
jgi:diguanylate cyclase (GGDEF)-like protein